MHVNIVRGKLIVNQHQEPKNARFPDPSQESTDEISYSLDTWMVSDSPTYLSTITIIWHGWGMLCKYMQDLRAPYAGFSRPSIPLLFGSSDELIPWK